MRFSDFLCVVFFLAFVCVVFVCEKFLQPLGKGGANLVPFPQSDVVPHNCCFVFLLQDTLPRCVAVTALMIALPCGFLMRIAHAHHTFRETHAVSTFFLYAWNDGCVLGLLLLVVVL